MDYLYFLHVDQPWKCGVQYFILRQTYLIFVGGTIMSWLVDISLVKSCSSIPPTLLMNTRNLLMLRRKAATDHQYLRF